MSNRIALAAVFGALVLLAAPLAHGQTSGVLRRVMEHGRIDRAAARDAVSTVESALRASGRRGGNQYDAIAQVLGVAMFGGPGSSRAEYDSRLAQVNARLRAGLTEENLTAFFGAGDGVALRCARLFSIPIGQCDVLIAGATQTTADFPYLAPNDGVTLAAELRDRGLSRADARTVADAALALVLSVPGHLGDTARGRTLQGLLDRCPPRLRGDLEAHVRAWHLGATPDLVRCIVGRVARQRDGEDVLANQLGVGPSAAVLLRWVQGQSLSPPVAEAEPSPSQPPPASSSGGQRVTLMNEAGAHYRARRFAEAASTYALVTQLEPSYAPAHQGLAASRLASGDAAGAVAAYRTAARLAPTSADVQVGLGRALVRTGDPASARHAFDLALTLEPGRADARRELAALSAAAAPRPAPAPSGPSAEATRAIARAHFAARRFDQAAAAYRALTQSHPRDAGAWAGLGGSLLAQRDAAGAAAAYRQAVEIDANRAGFWAALGAAEGAAGNRTMAQMAFQRALSIEPNHGGARAGLARLGSSAPAPQPAPRPAPPPRPVAPPPRPVAPPPPPRPSGPTLPETPGRADIVRVLVPLQTPLEACAPDIGGRVLFRIVIRGADGAVLQAELEGPHAGSDAAHCMESQLRGATFPRFAREQIEIHYPFQLVR